MALHTAPDLLPADGRLLPGSAAGHGGRGADGAGLSPALERSTREDEAINTQHSSLCQRECHPLIFQVFVSLVHCVLVARVIQLQPYFKEL